MKEEEFLKKSNIVSLVEDWSKTFGLPCLDKEQFPNIGRVSLCLDLIEEEFMETVQAVDHKDLKEVKDGLGDLLWVTVRAMLEFGIKPDEVITEIYLSNMSKADLSEEDAMRTRDLYKEQGIDTFMRCNNKMYITYNSETNKVLKSYKFIAPHL